MQRDFAKFEVLQLQGSNCVIDIWAGEDSGSAVTHLEWELDEEESAVFKLTPRNRTSVAS